MMFNVKDNKTLYMFDPFSHLEPRRLKSLQNSWANIFREDVLPHLPVEMLRKHYHNSHGRPSNELSSIMGAMILQQTHDLTDEETAEQYAFNIQWHYALNITNNSDTYSYVCPKSLWTMRQILTENNLYLPLFESASKKLGDIFDVDFCKQRIDSVHICSNMRHLGRIGLFVEIIKKFLRNLKRHQKGLFSALEKEFVDQYLSKEGNSSFSMVKPSKAAKTLKNLAKDLFFLTERYAGDKNIASMSSYQLMVRLLKEQWLVKKDAKDSSNKVQIKANKDVPSDSLQSHADPDAGYSGHKGKGYQVQIMETYSPAETEKSLSLITHVAVEPANESDANALLPAIDAAKQRDMAPEELLADSLYGGDQNCADAKERGVEVVAPVMGKPEKSKISLSDFVLSAKGNVKACPHNQAPIKVKDKGKRINLSFALETCAECPYVQDCPVKPGKRAYYLNYYKAAARVAQRKAAEKTPEFIEKYRYRAGVEATMSYYDKKTGVKKLRVRGLKAVSFAATLKALGVNIHRATAFRKRQKNGNGTYFSIFLVCYEHIQVIKELFEKIPHKCARFFYYFKCNKRIYLPAAYSLFTRASIIGN